MQSDTDEEEEKNLAMKDEESDEEEEEDEEEEGEQEEEDEEDGDDDEVGEEDEEENEPALFTDPFHIKDTRTPKEVTSSFDSIEDPEQLMEWLISPLQLSSFFEAVFEQQPALVSRPNNRDYYKGLLSRDEIDSLLRKKDLKYQYNVDVTHYSRKGVRENFNFNGDEASKSKKSKKKAKSIEKDDTGEKQQDTKSAHTDTVNSTERADADVIWRRVDKEGCSMRLLHPQRFSNTLWRLLSQLEEFWRSPMGSNSYLTPAGCQGFAPHFDDIDAFILQLEGAKRWRLHAPTDPRNILPRYPSRDFTQDEVGEVIMDVVLQPGDLLYLPRGMVHQAESLPDSHSLHLTISANSARDRTWQSLFEAVLPRALTLAAAEHKELRASVPRELTMSLGTALLPVDNNGEDGFAIGGQSAAEIEREIAKESVMEYAKACLTGIMESVDFDWGADHWDTEFLMQRLPPPPAVETKDSGGASGSGSRPPKVRDTTRVRMIHPGAARLMIDADGEVPMALVAHSLSNQRDDHAAKEKADGGDGGGGNAKDVKVDEIIPSVLEFPIGCAETLAGFLTAIDEEGVAVGAVPEPESEDEEDGETLSVSSVDVTNALIQAGLLKVVASPPLSKKRKY